MTPTTPTTRSGRDAIPCVRRAVEGIASPLRRPCDDRTAQSPSPPGPTMRAPSWRAALARVDHGARYYPARPRGPAVEGLASRRRQTTEDGRSMAPPSSQAPPAEISFFPSQGPETSRFTGGAPFGCWRQTSQAGAVACPRNHSDRAVDDVARDPPIPPYACVASLGIFRQQ